MASVNMAAVRWLAIAYACTSACSFRSNAGGASDGRIDTSPYVDARQVDAPVDAVADVCIAPGSFRVCTPPPGGDITLGTQTIATVACTFVSNGATTSGHVYDPGNNHPRICVVAGNNVT